MAVTDTLDNILSGKQEAAPAEERPVETQAEQPQETVETQAEERAESDRQKMVPHEALHAEKQKVKRYTEEVAEFRRSNENLQKQVAELLQRVPVPQKEQQQPIEWFENPGGAFDQNFQQSINPILSPIAQTVQTLQSELAQMRAERVFGDKFGEFMEYLKANANDPDVVALSAAMDRAPNPYAYAKEWFEKKTFNPESERERIREELLKELQEQQPPQTPPAVMPSNLAAARNVGTRSGPQWSGPPPIGEILKQATIFK
jgi:hypothetical protein